MPPQCNTKEKSNICQVLIHNLSTIAETDFFKCDQKLCHSQFTVKAKIRDTAMAHWMFDVLQCLQFHIHDIGMCNFQLTYRRLPR